MRFMTLIRSAENPKRGPPPPTLFQALAKLGGEAAHAGVLVETAGLLPTTVGARVRLAGGKISVSAGPFAGDQEVVGAYAIFDVPSKADAIEWARRFMAVQKEHWKEWEGETEVREMMKAESSAANHA